MNSKKNKFRRRTECDDAGLLVCRGYHHRVTDALRLSLLHPTGPTNGSEFTTLVMLICISLPENIQVLNASDLQHQFLTMKDKNFIWVGILLVQPKSYSLNSRSTLRDATPDVHELTPNNHPRFKPTSGVSASQETDVQRQIAKWKSSPSRALLNLPSLQLHLKVNSRRMSRAIFLKWSSWTNYSKVSLDLGLAGSISKRSIDSAYTMRVSPLGSETYTLLGLPFRNLYACFLNIFKPQYLVVIHWFQESMH
ncbi:hypothetical protein C8J56DRAFT_898956 [Mycena floridula]|nr:hypothetical protein C8J56DRAFT_898956 [Mycena floridula]